MENIIGYPEKSLAILMKNWGEKPYRATQILTWVYHKRVSSFQNMTNLSKSLRERLHESFFFALPRVESRTLSHDGTIKYLFKMEDGSKIESVWMPDEGRKTLCLSTQVGCRLACAFCLTGKMGLKRNLLSAEILGQIMAIDVDLGREKNISNIVIMGMGEPLDNYEETVKALRLIVSPHALKLSNRKVTLSTSGLVDKIERFKNEGLQVNLAVSLNASDDKTRSQIMPINKKYSIRELMKCLSDYPLKPTRRITFEYVLINGINDSLEDAVKLGKLLSGFKCKINLIPFNSFEQTNLLPPNRQKVMAFQEYLMARKHTVFVRRNRATDILGACGQLAVDQDFTSHSTLA